MTQIWESELSTGMGQMDKEVRRRRQVSSKELNILPEVKEGRLEETFELGLEGWVGSGHAELEGRAFLEEGLR